MRNSRLVFIVILFLGFTTVTAGDTYIRIGDESGIELGSDWNQLGVGFKMDSGLGQVAFDLKDGATGSFSFAEVTFSGPESISGTLNNLSITATIDFDGPADAGKVGVGGHAFVASGFVDDKTDGYFTTETYSCGTETYQCGTETYYCGTETYYCGTETYQCGTTSYVCGKNCTGIRIGDYCLFGHWEYDYCTRPRYCTRARYCTQARYCNRPKYCTRTKYCTRNVWISTDDNTNHNDTETTDLILNFNPIAVSFGNSEQFIIDISDIDFTDFGTQKLTAYVTLDNKIIPEPVTILLLGVGLTCLVVIRRRRRK